MPIFRDYAVCINCAGIEYVTSPFISDQTSVTPAFEHLLATAKETHNTCRALAEFCAFPDDLTPAPFEPQRVNAADLMDSDVTLQASARLPLARAFLEAGADAKWRETYKNTSIGQDFMDRFGCYCLIGNGGPWISAKMAAYVVYMPAGLPYTWHHHPDPAEELYFVLAGEAQFYCEGSLPLTLGAGDASFHASNRPHAMETFTHPVLAYVLWRSHFDTPPVLTSREVVS